MWIFYEAIFQKGKESLKKRKSNSNKLGQFHSQNFIPTIDSFSQQRRASFVLEINRFFPPPLRKRNPPFVPSLDSSSIFPHSSVSPPAKRDRENRTTMHRFSQRAEEANPLNEEGRWYEWNVIVRRQIHARAGSSFCRCPGWNSGEGQGRGGTGNPGLTYFQPHGQTKMVESRALEIAVNTA